MPEIRREDVSLPAGDAQMRAFFAHPGATRAPAIVLIPDVHGLSPLYREIAERFAGEGVAALAVDLYTREGAPRLASVDEAMRWIAALDDRRVLRDVQAAADWLDGREDVGRVGVTGFCMGGQYALLGACSLPGLSACVSFYGMVRYAERNAWKPQSPLDVAEVLRCPYLGIFGEDDGLIPREDVAELERRLAAAGKTFEIRSYPGCGHAFLNHNRADAYRPEAAADAFHRAVRFFQRHLAPADGAGGS
ncbi:MAG: carboxymethylenebutenolidase [Candidatus Binatota bacterium]|nr:carboxymethylenebutenolidase [Candidatus Binatota bacterium]